MAIYWNMIFHDLAVAAKAATAILDMEDDPLAAVAADPAGVS